MRHRLTARLAQLSHEELLDVISLLLPSASDAAVEVVDSYAAERQPLPEWALSKVLLSHEDLLPHILSNVSTKNHEVKAVCCAWRRSWRATLAERPSELRLSSLPVVDLPPERSEDYILFDDVVSLDDNCLMLTGFGEFQLYRQWEPQLEWAPLEQLEPINVKDVDQLIHMCVGNESVYVSSGNDVKRFALEGFTSTGMQTLMAKSDQGPLELSEPLEFSKVVLSPDCGTLFAFSHAHDDYHYPFSITAFDALTLKIRFQFGCEIVTTLLKSYDEDLDKLPALTIMNEELFCGTCDKNKIIVFSLSGMHIRTIPGGDGHCIAKCRNQQLRTINERLYLISDDANICEIDANGRLLQQFNMTMQVGPPRRLFYDDYTDIRDLKVVCRYITSFCAFNGHICVFTLCYMEDVDEEGEGCPFYKMNQLVPLLGV